MKHLMPVLCVVHLAMSGCSAGVPSQHGTPSLLSISTLTITPKPTIPPVITTTSLPSLTPWPTSVAPTLTPLASSPSFFIGNVPFRFVAAIVPGWFWAHGEGTSPADVAEDLIVSAKASGISMIHLPVPLSIESPIGVFSEDDFAELDFLLDTAARNGLYVMPVLMDGYGLAEQTEFAYHNPAGFAGLILDPRLSDAYRERIRTFVLRRNSINGKLYRDDPTIFGWDIMAEPSGHPTSPVLTLP